MGGTEMLDVADLKVMFADKLKATGSMDQAFTKAVWVAYKAGIRDGSAHEHPEQVVEGDTDRESSL